MQGMRALHQPDEASLPCVLLPQSRKRVDAAACRPPSGCGAHVRGARTRWWARTSSTLEDVVSERCPLGDARTEVSRAAWNSSANRQRRVEIMRDVSALEAVPGFPNGEKMARRSGVILQLAAQLDDVRVDRAAHHRRLVPPHLTQQLRALRDGAVAAHERHEEIELLRPERHRRA